MFVPFLGSRGRIIIVFTSDSISMIKPESRLVYMEERLGFEPRDREVKSFQDSRTKPSYATSPYGGLSEN